MTDNNFWTDTNRLFGSINPSRAKVVASIVNKLKSPLVLDLGCGNQSIKDFLDKEICRYIPSDLVSRSDDCIVIDLDESFPAGFYHTILSIGLIGYLRNRKRFYLRVARSCQYWISSVSAASALVSRYECTKRESIGLSEELFVHEALEYFNLHGRTTSITGCRLFTWMPKTLQERRQLRALRRASIRLPEWNLNTKGEWLRSHVHRRSVYMDRITEALLQPGITHAAGGLIQLNSHSSSPIRYIDIRIGEDIATHVENARIILASDDCEYMIVTIGYSKKDADNGSPYEPGRFEMDIYNETIERCAMLRYTLIFYDLTPDYDILSIFKRVCY